MKTPLNILAFIASNFPDLPGANVFSHKVGKRDWITGHLFVGDVRQRVKELAGRGYDVTDGPGGQVVERR